MFNSRGFAGFFLPVKISLISPISLVWLIYVYDNDTLNDHVIALWVRLQEVVTELLQTTTSMNIS